MSKFNQANERFEIAVRKLQDNLQYLADQGKVSVQFLSIQSNIIKALIDYQHEVLNSLEAYDQLTLDLSIKNSQKYNRLVSVKESFEAICIIHGIMDFRVWMAKGKSYLISEAVYHHRNGEVQLPSSFIELINGLPQHERETLWAILNKKAFSKWNRQFGIESKAYA
ncbi:hypothetical protein BFP72_06025 [Reichenbachiella sp. 5M10]|uniref:hypothetical protein n=1 Tax=Reichenbachiella sp. 5M10 TaxID=1889772 RepID=UPI000C14AE58|nr:hypothetical protein [Reichenbachiella sp. 5M10]PIB34980.1 hypothetical protein BFP72_06025 [Reichenbachiella sp. 5M10]